VASKDSVKGKAARVARRKPVVLEADTFADRIVGQGMANPQTLKANPANWRTHSVEQREAMREVLREVGWVQRVIVNRTTGHLLDGHLRVEEAVRAGVARIPVVFVELSEEEERRILAVLDPIGGMAGVDKKRLRALVEDMRAGTPGLDRLLAQLREKVGLKEEPERPEVEFTEELMEEHNYLVLYFDNPVDWLNLQSVFPLKEVKSLRSEGRFQQVGVGRVVKGSEFLNAVMAKKGE